MGVDKGTTRLATGGAMYGSMNKPHWIVERVGASVFEQLSEGLAGSELQSVLLHVMQRRASARQPSEILAQYQRDPFCTPAPVDLRTSISIDTHLLAAAEGFEALELSPVAPLGSCAAVALTNQNRVLSTLRMTEVVSDPTNVLALECARRIRARPGKSVHLASSQRILRTQRVPVVPGYSPHFRIFVLASGGQETKDHGFTSQTVVRHVRTFLTALDQLERHGYTFGVRRVDVLATPERLEIAERIATTLGGGATCRPLEHPYYSGGIRYQIWATAPDGDVLPLGDGGVFNWLGKVAANRRATYVASGIGAQLIAMRFRVQKPI